MVRLIMGEKGTGKTKKLIEMVNSSAAENPGSTVCIEANSSMTYNIHYNVRLVVAEEYQIANYDTLRGLVSGLYAGNYDINHIFIDNLFKIVKGSCDPATDKFLVWLDKFSENHGVKFTMTISADESAATDVMRRFL